MTHPTNPYPGPRSFETGEKLYGRRRETRELLDLLIAERILLFYSPSGAGKTSLIRAALLPELEKEGYRILPIMRPGLEPEEPVDAKNRYILSLLLCLEKDLSEEERTPVGELAGMALMEYLERYDHGRRKEDGDDRENDRYDNWYGDVLIFDQFEEVLTADPTDREAKIEFFRQVGLVLRNPHHWAFFSMREEFVAGLDPYLRFLPTRLDATYRLELLGVDAAKDAMQKPAKTVNRDFTDAAAKQLIDNLRSVKVQQPDGSMQNTLGPYIEPVQLQVVCRRLWDKPGVLDDNVIDVDDLMGVGDVDQALRGYYADSVVAIAKDENIGVPERTIREWVGQKLITDQGIRGQVMKGFEYSEGLSNQAIQGLEDAHLVRAEPRRGVIWFELAHDRLVRPVQEDNAVWFDEHLSTLQRQAGRWHREHHNPGLLLRGQTLREVERWAEVYRDDLEDHEEAFLTASREAYARDLELQKSRRLSRRAVIGLVVVLLLAVLAGIGWSKSLSATEKANEATEKADTEAKRADTEAKRANSLMLVNLAQSYLSKGNTAAALLLSVEADKIASLPQTQEALLAALDASYTPHGSGESDALSALAWTDDSPVSDADRLVSGVTAGATMATVRDGQVILWWNDGETISETLSISSSVPITVAAFNPGGTLLALADTEGNLTLWRQSAGTKFEQRSTPEMADDEGVTALAFSQDGSQLAAAICESSNVPSASGASRPEQGKAKGEGGEKDEKGEKDPLSGEASTGGASLQQCDSVVIRTWRVDPGSASLTNDQDSVSLEESQILDLVYSSNGASRLAWISDGQLFVGTLEAELDDYDELQRRDQKLSNRGIILIPGSAWLIAAGCIAEEEECASGFVQIWDVEKRDSFGPTFNSSTAIRDIGYVAGQRRLVTLGAQGSEVWWEIGAAQEKYENWRALACQAAERNLTASEWEKAFDGTDYEDTCEEYGRHFSFAQGAVEEGEGRIDECRKSTTNEAMTFYENALELGEQSDMRRLPFANPSDGAVRGLLNQALQDLNQDENDTGCFDEVDRLLFTGDASQIEAIREIWSQLAEVEGNIRGKKFQGALDGLNDTIDVGKDLPDIVKNTLRDIRTDGYRKLCFSDIASIDIARNACNQLTEFADVITLDETVSSNTVFRTQVWVFNGEDGDIITIDMDTTDPDFEPSLTLVGPDGRELASDDDGGGDFNALIQDFILPENGVYLISASSRNGPGSYVMSLSMGAPPTLVSMNTSVESTTREDTLWTFEGEAGDVVTIAMDTTGPNFDPFLTLVGPDGRELTSDDDGGGGLNALIQNFVLPESEDYFIRTGPIGSSAQYTLSLRTSAIASIEFDEPVTDTTDAQSLWTFNGKVGDIVTIAMDAEADGLDPYLRLIRPDGRELASDDDSGGGLNALIEGFVLSEDGEYMISATGLSGSGSYSLLLSKGRQPKPIAIDQAIESTTQEDLLWIFAGEIGDIITINLAGANEDFDPELTLMDKDGGLLAKNDDSGEGWNGYDARIQGFVLPATDEYLIRAGRSGSSEIYALSITQENPLAATPPAKVDVSEGIAWTFDGRMGQLIYMALESEDEESALPQLTLLGVSGTLAAKDVSGILAPLSQTGSYTMVITGGSSEPGTQFLTLQEITATVNSLTYSHPVSGQLDAGVTEYWSFTGDANQAAAINVTEGGERVFMELYGPNGGLLRTYDGGAATGESALVSSIPLTGTYYLTVRSREPAMAGPYALALEPTGQVPIPQTCDPDAPESAADYGPIRVGSRVILGRHRPVDGSRNWAESMTQYMGEETVVTDLRGVDNNGCPVVSVDIDDGEWIWRIRDMTFIP